MRLRLPHSLRAIRLCPSPRQDLLRWVTPQPILRLGSMMSRILSMKVYGQTHRKESMGAKKKGKKRLRRRKLRAWNGTVLMVKGQTEAGRRWDDTIRTCCVRAATFPSQTGVGATGLEAWLETKAGPCCSLKETMTLGSIPTRVGAGHGIRRVS